MYIDLTNRKCGDLHLVKAVEPLDDFNLYLIFNNKEHRLFDCSSFNFSDRELFKQVIIKNGTTVWPNEFDICPDKLYVNSTPIPVENQINLTEHI